MSLIYVFSLILVLLTVNSFKKCVNVETFLMPKNDAQNMCDTDTIFFF